MKKFIFAFLLILTILFIPNNTLAKEWYKGQYGCSYSEINKLRTLTSAIKFDVKYLGNIRNNEYGIQITNVSKDLEVYFNDEKVDTTKIFNDLYPSTYYTFVIKVSGENYCKGLLEVTKKVTIPDHNYYYDEELCKGAEDLEICDPNYDSTQITGDEFEQMIEEHKNSIDKKENKFIEFSKKYWYVYVIVLAVITSVIIIVFRKRRTVKF